MRCLLFLILLAGCARNPVTGDNELAFISEEREIAIGTEYYPLLTQVEGGPYVVDPNVQEYVAGVGTKIASLSGRPGLPYEFTVLNNSIPNAWSLPGGKIGINRGLLDKLQSEAELAAVLSHEIVHSAARHTAQAIQRGMIMEGGMAVLSQAIAGSSYEDVVMGTADVSADLVATKYSRSAESEADKYGMRYMAAAGYDPEAAVDLQRTFLKLQEGKDNHHWLDGLFASHPPTEDRLTANQETAATLPKGGKLGLEVYEETMEQIVAAIPAYEALDEGYKRLYVDRDPQGALKFADEGLDHEPNEGHLYNLKGKAQRQLGMKHEALASFVRAHELNNRYFDFPLQRGLLEYEFDDYASARPSLEESVRLLPTSQGHYTLGKIAMSEGRMGDAMNHFRLAQQSPTAELLHSPNPRPTPFETAADAKVYVGRVDRELTFYFLNRSKFQINHITVEVTFYTEKQELISTDTFTFPVRLESGASVHYRSGVRAPAGTAYAEIIVLSATNS